MATYTLSHTVRSSIEYLLANGQSAFVVLHFGVDGPGAVTQTDVDDCAARTVDLATDAFGGFHLYDFMSTAVTIVAAHARTVDPANPLAADVAINQAGAHPSEPLPPESAIVTTHYTALASRRGRGRSFLPGWSVEVMANGLVAAGALPVLQDVWDIWRAGTPVGGPTFAVWSPTNNTAQSVTASTVRSIFHHQSSRNP